jgi:hypothetical protein
MAWRQSAAALLPNLMTFLKHAWGLLALATVD